jgi:O-antigen/teichoic acid export membrane protein
MTDGEDGRSLFARTASGAGWMIAWRASTRLLGLASTLILVRLLAPSDFGLISLAASFVLIVDAATFIGVEDSLVRGAAPSRALLDTAFTLNVLRAGLSAIVIACLAAPAAAFLSEPALETVILLLAATMALEGFRNIGTVAFRRELAFDKEFRLQVLPRIAGVVVTVTLAIVLRSYWALLWALVLQRVLRVALSYGMHPYRPRFSLAAWRELIGFSAWAWAIMLAMQIRDRSESLLIGRMLGTSELGVYETGKDIAMLPASELVEPICHAAYSGFAESRNAGRPTSDACLRVIAMLALLALPAGFGLSLIAAPLVRLAFGPAWLGAIPVIQALGIAGATAGFGMACNTLLRAHGLMRLSFRITILAAPTHIALVLIAIPLGGLPAAAAAIAAAIILGRFGSLLVTFRHFKIGFGALARRVWRSVAAVTAMAGILWWSGLGWTAMPPDSPLACALAIAGASALGAAVYLLTLLALWSASGRPAGAEADAIEIARRRFPRFAPRVRET